MKMSKGFSRLAAMLLVLAVPALIVAVSTFNINMKDGGAARLAHVPFVPAAAIAASPLPGPKVIGNLSQGGVINGCGGVVNNCAAGVCGTMAPCLANYSRVMCQANPGAIATPANQATALAFACWPTAGYATITTTATPGGTTVATQTVTGTGIFILWATSTNAGTTPTIMWHGEN